MIIYSENNRRLIFNIFNSGNIIQVRTSHSIEFILFKSLIKAIKIEGNSYGVDSTGQACVGCGPQEEFYGNSKFIENNLKSH